MGRKLITATWDDAPHLAPEEKEQMYEALPPHQRDARSKGVPALGAGAIYPIPESEIVCDPVELPAWYERSAGFDVGWNWTAAVWIARNPETRQCFLYDCYKAGKREPAVHAAGVKARGEWIPIAIDPASRGRGQRDGEQLYQDYFDLGLDLVKADNSREAGIYKVWQMLSSGQLKIFKTCVAVLEEYRLYHRDEKGQIVKENDHCIKGDTKVLTDKGYFEIKDLVGTTGKVLGLDGRWVTYRNCRMTQRNADLIELTFSDGYRLQCTPDHKILTERGWVTADKLTTLDSLRYNDITQSNQWSYRCRETQKLYQTQRSGLEELPITYAASIIREMVCDYIEKCGSRVPTALSLTGTISTTKTMIAQIIGSTTWSARQQRSTSATTQKAYPNHFPSKHWTQQRNGMGVRKDVGGISSTMKQSKKSYTRELRKLVSDVVSTLRWRNTGDFALTNARLRGDEIVGWTRSLQSAVSAESRSQKTSTSKSKLAAKSARVSLLTVQKQRSDDVYCMEVPDGNAFTIENGLIIHNCLDALRYNCVTGINYGQPTPNEDDFNDYSQGRRQGDQVTGY